MKHDRQLTFRQAKIAADEIIDITSEDADKLPALQGKGWRYWFLIDGWYLDTATDGRKIFYKCVDKHETIFMGVDTTAADSIRELLQEARGIVYDMRHVYMTRNGKGRYEENIHSVTDLLDRIDAALVKPEQAATDNQVATV